MTFYPAHVQALCPHRFLKPTAIRNDRVFVCEWWIRKSCARAGSIIAMSIADRFWPIQEPSRRSVSYLQELNVGSHVDLRVDCEA